MSNRERIRKEIFSEEDIRVQKLLGLLSINQQAITIDRAINNFMVIKTLRILLDESPYANDLEILVQYI
ncbi:MAG: hypothetical protein AAFY76_07705, partial [Cyanobacteria bacterium J06649_11]